MADIPDPVMAACEQHWPAHKYDCSGFVKAVATDLSIELFGQANQIIDYLDHSARWQNLGADPATATTRANSGEFVIAGLKATGHGHLAVVVKSNSGRYPIGYWGQFGGIGKRKTSLNFSWRRSDWPKVQFYAAKL
ncbi:hypothetical protein E4L96_11060 [Massilia arenosa]|uniref:Peptidoglycan endopeptidase n=1 Tax=Zemynaea arenosa TaxID=2561931 RepID=A0A4Y9SBW1_9BURK|nr:hypothetical protein [Massilia arenosa]TFW19881.1 hypothetical protein E4L96_11060 [Massilia arenosa]